jgi:hypothetical protein
MTLLYLSSKRKPNIDTTLWQFILRGSLGKMKMEKDKRNNGARTNLV